MAKYVFNYHGGRAPETEEEGQAVMQAWMSWFGSLGDAVVDPGAPFGEPKTVSSDGSVTVGGGANPATGYSVVQAGTIDEAVSMAKGCPILDDGGSVVVAEALPM